MKVICCLLAVSLGPASLAQLAPPHRVNKSFTGPKRQPFVPPHFADAKAKTLTYAMLHAERNLCPTRIKIAGEGGGANIAWDRGRIRQDGAGGSWVYRSGLLTVRCKKGLYQGSANRADVLDYVTALTGGPDTLARELLVRQYPFEDFLNGEGKVRLAGQIVFHGDKADILKITGRALNASLWVRHRDHLVLSADADSLTPTGSLMYRAHRTYTYLPLGDSRAMFQLPRRRGEKVKPLPKSAIKLGKFRQ